MGAKEAPMKSWLVLAVSLALAGCAGTELSERAAKAEALPLFHDALFAPPSQRVSADVVFSRSDAMRHYLDVEIADLITAKGRQRALYEALYSKNQLKIEYDAAITRNAAEAFDARSGNCLSLVIMTAALAKELGLDVHFQRVFTDEAWTRSEGLVFASGHVNVTLGRKVNDPRVARVTERQVMTIDFLPVGEFQVQHAYVVGEETIVAMYMNNRAAEMLAAGKLDDAYWWARGAIEQDPLFYSSYNTLGIVYRHHGDARESEQVLRFALAREPRNAHVMSNLALVLKQQGRLEESQTLMQRVAELQPNPPFYFFDRGMVALRQKDYAAARDLFLKELGRDPYNHEVHFALAAAYFGLGDLASTRSYLRQAMENSTTRKEHDIYAAKLARIAN
jgi:Tfp pilus assembly protein PilF